MKVFIQDKIIKIKEMWAASLFKSPMADADDNNHYTCN